MRPVLDDLVVIENGRLSDDHHLVPIQRFVERPDVVVDP
jgi:hypothetical protein